MQIQSGFAAMLRGVIRVQTSRDVGHVWLVTAIIFAATVTVVRLMGRNPDTKTTALWIGYVGLAALGAALLLTARWVDQSGPSSLLVRVALYTAIAVALVLWLLALVFPFL